jgi:hypothetical protein
MKKLRHLYIKLTNIMKNKHTTLSGQLIHMLLV